MKHRVVQYLSAKPPLLARCTNIVAPVQNERIFYSKCSLLDIKTVVFSRVPTRVFQFTKTDKAQVSSLHCATQDIIQAI